MLPPESGEAIEVGIGAHHDAAVLDGHRGVLGVCDELSFRLGLAAQPLEDSEVIGAGSDDTSRRATHEFGGEGEDFLQRRGGLENTRIRRDSDETGEGEDRKRERFGSGGEPGDPIRIPHMVGS